MTLRTKSGTYCLLLSIILMMVGCEQTTPTAQTSVRSVRYIEVAESVAQRVRTFTGVSKSEQEAKLSFKVTGTLIKLGVAVGDTIEPGQVIAEVDAFGYQLQLQQAQADLTRATAEQRNADAAYQRTRELYENQNASKIDLDAARTAFESTQALVNAAQRAVDLSRLNVSYTRLVAKEACSVASTSADAGENIAIGQEIVRVNCGDQLKVDVSIPENLISLFSPGMAAIVEFDSVPDTRFDGEVTEIGVAATGTTFPVSVRLLASTGLRAGLAAQVGFRFSSGAVYPSVPTTSVAEDQNGRYIYLLMPGASPELAVTKRQPVEVGNMVADGIEIVRGVNPGDKVVTAGVSVIRDGLVVKAN